MTCQEGPGLPPSAMFFFFNDTATTEIYTLSLHDALPILFLPGRPQHRDHHGTAAGHRQRRRLRSEEHTSELQSQSNLVCRLLLEKTTLPSALKSPAPLMCHAGPGLVPTRTALSWVVPFIT